MGKPILSLSSGDAPKATANLLPCRINHDGSVEPVDSFWNPRTGEDGTRTAFFRGRKLQGKTVKLPEGYRGVVAATAPKEEEKNPALGAELIDLEYEGQERPPKGALNVQAEFEEMVVWGHEATADATADPYVRGMEEWLALADQIHSYPASNKK